MSTVNNSSSGRHRTESRGSTDGASAALPGKTRRKKASFQSQGSVSGAGVSPVVSKPVSKPGSLTKSRQQIMPYHLPCSVEVPRVSVTEVRPVVEDGRWPAKAAINELFPVYASIFIDGHAQFGADAVVLQPVNPQHQGRGGYDLYAGAEAVAAGTAPDPTDPRQWKVVRRTRMREVGEGLSQYEGWLNAPEDPGRYAFAVESWMDPYLTWVHDASVKIDANVDVELTLEQGAQILQRAVDGTAHSLDSGRCEKAALLDPIDQAVLNGAIAGLREKRHQPKVRLAAATTDLVKSIMEDTPLRDLCSRSRLFPLRVDRQRSLAGSWYEIFPRSIGSYRDESGMVHSGTLRSAAQILPDVAADGYDVVYLTPIHPIGHAFRKGRNNSLSAQPDDPGSPWAIGNEHGGHDAVNPDLGTMADFDAFVACAKDNGLEVALDIAWQCSPDHPWVKEHPQWFTSRPDGTIAYAENPPKKYQDIYPLNFDQDPDGLYLAIRNVLEHWISHGVTIFRMDNPHTKPVRFWQRLAADLHRDHPEVVMLAEAFTKPAMMRGLAKAGFHLSYSYFTWRNSKEELREYLEELAYGTAHVLRPALFPMTPDILTDYLTQGVEAFRVRALLAATAAPTWGILGGSWEFCEHVQRPGVEEGLDNQKYEIKVYDWADRDRFGLASLNRKLNEIRRAHPSLLQLRNIRFHATDNENLLVYSKHLPAYASPEGRADTVLVVVNLDAKNTQSGWLHLDLPSLGLDPEVFPQVYSAGEGELFQVHDVLNGGDYVWSAHNFLELNPFDKPGHVFRFSPLGGGS